MSDGGDPYEGPEEEDSLILSPQVEEALFSLDTPADVMSAVSSVMVEMREALEPGVLPPSGRPLPGISGAYVSAMPRGLGLIEFHETATEKGSAGSTLPCDQD
ncbi:hypothetical protein F0345_23145 [Streptomyces rutgersensis]|uniref:Uncharacterized protein n=1 Tax=Streptomyces rutgersensis TaxID=53451 RepID=A0ABX6RT72_9ACTN|nr:hypothetical protein [Streptomyces rutgersensis]QNE83651.1 hypothetical protein F0345_23145 [Streptomyces rutgersensis]